jgi:excisionase family DNA binding protein
MQSHQKFTTNHPDLAGSGANSARRTRASGWLAHLAFMDPRTFSETSGSGVDDVVISGAFEPALSLKELAAQLHVSVQTLYDLRSQGRGPTGFRVGRHLRFRQSEIQAWLERMEAEDDERHRRGSRR